MGKSAPSDSANSLFFCAVSVLAAKYVTSNSRILSPLSRSDLHSFVHPPVNAFGNQARTTACLPL
jgi:hypothetical protein